ncbi:DNA-binding transcriptional regulator [Candidatus Roizmanbacteria bacterium]|nr:DNA-binding transcriptional regulator [Candidatus Roizmanbacteria bacterium]
MTNNQNESFQPRNEKEKRLVEAFASLKSKEDVANFLRDLLTIAEIEEFANRLEMVRLLLKGYSYLKVAKETGSSTTTVTRVAHWLNHGCGGYKRVMNKLRYI